MGGEVFRGLPVWRVYVCVVGFFLCHSLHIFARLIAAGTESAEFTLLTALVVLELPVTSRTSSYRHVHRPQRIYRLGHIR